MSSIFGAGPIRRANCGSRPPPSVYKLSAVVELHLNAATCGVNERTLRRWMANDQAFKLALGEARGVMFQAGMNRVQALASEAINTLVDVAMP